MAENSRGVEEKIAVHTLQQRMGFSPVRRKQGNPGERSTCFEARRYARPNDDYSGVARRNGALKPVSIQTIARSICSLQIDRIRGTL